MVVAMFLIGENDLLMMVTILQQAKEQREMFSGTLLGNKAGEREVLG